ncbi:Uncharacterized protein OBRU01_03947 [Operophtera brumata]|uniref:FLYWCH-type domain-containing protein n=1 Tax=Operophtera brumata TaxID=104452 RepID=A0A0L7LGB2_OPEBR|nr:Uncharacterized protein OBRU01_03947 [Operophtera brumata]
MLQINQGEVQSLCSSEFITLINGCRLLTIGGYTFRRTGGIGAGGSRYTCSKSCRLKCKAFAHVSANNLILKCSIGHTQYITLVNGCRLLTIDGFTFSKDSSCLRDGRARYSCSRYERQKCRAYVHVSTRDVILKYYAEHNHPPPKMHKTMSGKYLLTDSRLVKVAAALELVVLGINAPKICARTEFITLINGCRLLTIGGYTFRRTGGIGAGGSRYTCSKSCRLKCKAFAHVSANNLILKCSIGHTQYITLVNGCRLLTIDGFTFSKDSSCLRDGGARYSCSRVERQKCRAYVHVSTRDVILKYYAEHNHPPPKMHKTMSGKYLLFITLLKGPQLLIYKGYSFTKHYMSQEQNARYKCANATNRSCKAHVYVNYAGNVIKSANEHNHEPNKYKQTSCGKYVKTKTQYITLASGTKLLIIGEHTYKKQKMLKAETQSYRFICSCYRTTKCKAFAHVSHDSIIVKTSLEHNHPPTKYMKTKTQFIKLKGGTWLLKIGEYTYYKQGEANKIGEFRYRCSSYKRKKCQAQALVSHDGLISMIETAQYITLTSGTRLLMIGEYGYYKQGVIKKNGRHGHRFTCSSTVRTKCKAYVHVSNDDFIMKVAGEHSHPPTKYLKTSNGYIKYITLASGTRLLMIGEYGYYKKAVIKMNGRHGHRYGCSSFVRTKCKAYVHVSNDDFIMKVAGEHSHPPTKYLKTTNGLLMIGEYGYHKKGVIKKNGRHGHRYVCSSFDKTNCKAYVHVSNDDFIMKVAGEHRHPPTKYLKTSNGYIKLNTSH